MSTVRGARARRTLLLALHLTASVGWVGAVCAYLVLAVAIPVSGDAGTALAAWTGMELVGWYALAPLSVLALVSGVVLALTSRWGLLQHYWVVVSLVGTTVLTSVLLAHLPDVSRRARQARGPDPGDVLQTSDVTHALLGLVLLVGILVLNVVKPAGLTRYGWRKQQERATTAARRSA